MTATPALQPAPGAVTGAPPAAAAAPLRAAAAVPPEQAFAVRAVTALTGAVVVLSFLFGFGNVWALGVRLGVPMYVAPLVAPAVDLSIIALLLGTRQLALRGGSAEQIRPARRLLVFCSLVTLALNVAEPLIAGHYGRAAFDAVGPFLLIGWAHVGPGLLQAMNETRGSPWPPPVVSPQESPGAVRLTASAEAAEGTGDTGSAEPAAVPLQRRGGGTRAAGGRGRDEDLLERARAEDARHWEAHRRPISAETLRRRLRVGTTRSRRLVAQVRADPDTGSGRAFPESEVGLATTATPG